MSRSTAMLRADYEERRGRIRCLERAYPIAKQLADILELEAIEPMSRTAKRLREDIAAELSNLGYPTNEYEGL